MFLSLLCFILPILAGFLWFSSLQEIFLDGIARTWWLGCEKLYNRRTFAHFGICPFELLHNIVLSIGRCRYFLDPGDVLVNGLMVTFYDIEQVACMDPVLGQGKINMYWIGKHKEVHWAEVRKLTICASNKTLMGPFARNG